MVDPRRKGPSKPVDYNPFGLPPDFWALKAEQLRDSLRYQPEKMEIQRWLKGPYSTLKLFYVLMMIKVQRPQDVLIDRPQKMVRPPVPLPEGQSPYTRNPWWLKERAARSTNWRKRVGAKR